MLVPIRVGMILITVLTKQDLYTCPHTRGDDPSRSLTLQILQHLSPYAWG